MRWKVNWWDVFFCWLMLMGVAILFFVTMSHAISTSNKEAKLIEERKEQAKFSTLPSFKIYYKDNGKKEVVVCESCVYGQTDDKIYFLSKSGKDTVKVVPKIEVEKVTTLDPDKVK